MIVKILILFLIRAVFVDSYTNYHTIVDLQDKFQGTCIPIDISKYSKMYEKKTDKTKIDLKKLISYNETYNYTYLDLPGKLENTIHTFMFGMKDDDDDEPVTNRLNYKGLSEEKMQFKPPRPFLGDIYVSGSYLQAEMFNNQKSVRMPFRETIVQGSSRLRVTKDRMQTAVDAFFILLHGNLKDALALPAEYVLRSARTISMMKLSREKLAAMWTVVKGNKKNSEITYETLDMFRPLFKYVNAREIASLNLSDTKILVYIGTHPEMDRHQIGIVASAYFKLNPKWNQPKYLNMMNNLICGMPMILMRKLGDTVYLQLSSQIFFHIHACDKMQRLFYLNMMTTTKVLGKSFSWGARDVRRLGVLMAEVKGPALAAIHPDAIEGISAQVISLMTPENLRFFTDEQIKHLQQKSLNVFSRKMKIYKEKCSNTCISCSMISIKCLSFALVLNRIVF